MKKGRKLILSDGTVFFGKGFGSDKEVVAEVIFHTGMTGYEKILTDGAYKEQAVVMTYPMIGNYGISQDDCDIPAKGASALIVKEYCEIPSNWQSITTLDEFMQERNIVGLCEIDTRALTLKIREAGTMKGIILDSHITDADAIAKLNTTLASNDQVKRISPSEVYKISAPNKKFRVVLITLGAEIEGIINELKTRDCDILVVPYSATAEAITKLNPNGIIIGNGPGNPNDISEMLPMIKEIQVKFPIFAIGLGFQILALANGATATKMKFGHHGANVPVKDVATGRTLITSQNHEFQVNSDSIAGAGLELTHFAINDNTVQGVKHESLPVFGVQFMPEIHTGPEDSQCLFDNFVENLGGAQ